MERRGNMENITRKQGNIIDLENRFFTSCPVCGSQIPNSGNILKLAIHISPGALCDVTPQEMIKYVIRQVMLHLPDNFGLKIERLQNGDYENVFIVAVVKNAPI